MRPTNLQNQEIMNKVKMSYEDKRKPEGTSNGIRVLSIGLHFHHPMVKNIKYKSNISLLEYEIIIWEPNSTISEYIGITYSKYDSSFGDISSLSEMEKFEGDIKRRKREMSKLLELGRSIIIFTPEPQRFGTQGTYELSTILPIENLQTVEASGKAIGFSGVEPFNKFWMINKDYLTYKAYFTECKEGVPIFFIKNTKEILGAHFRKGKGNLIFIPQFLDNYFSNISKKKEKEAINLFIESIIDLVSELNKGAGDFELPGWCLNYALPEEVSKLSELRRLEVELKEIKSKIGIQEKLLIELRKLKVLFSGDGRALELEVARIFKELGFEVTEGNLERADLTLKYDNKVAVVEIKGISKGAKESHARQLETWISDYFLQNGYSPKGILIINAYKDIPLANRNKNPFPDSMELYSRKREHCLLSGLQLLGIYLVCKNDPSKKKETIDLLFNTNGIFEKYKDWSEYIELI